MTPIQSLIAEMKAAEHGTPELSERMAECLGWKKREHIFQRWLAPDGREMVCTPPWTTDLNAILAEIDRVFPGAAIERRKRCRYHEFTLRGPHLVIQWHPTSLPLAACIALLRAIEARDNG